MYLGYLTKTIKKDAKINMDYLIKAIVCGTFIVASGCDQQPKEIYFPIGNCETGKLEVGYKFLKANQECTGTNPVYEDETMCVIAHPKFHFIDAESCFVESAATYLKLTARCIEWELPNRLPSLWTDGIDTGASSVVCKVVLPTPTPSPIPTSSPKAPELIP